MRTRTIQRWIYTAMLGGALLALSACSSATAKAGSPPAGGASPAVDVTSIRPEALLAVELSPAEAQTLYPSDQAWWATGPGFYVPPFLPYTGSLGRGGRFYIAEIYQQSGAPERSLYMTVSLYDDATAAATDLEAHDRDATRVAGPALGDARHYYTQRSTDTCATNEAGVRVQNGPMITRLALCTPDGFASPETLARGASLMAAKARMLLAGRLTAPQVDPSLLAALPPAVDGVGPVLGTAALAPVAWAANDLADPSNPQPVLSAQQEEARLRAGGVSQIGFRWYSLAAAPENVISVDILPFADAASAQAEAGRYADQVATNQAWTRLDAGNTGAASAFSKNVYGYELQFAAGRYVADVLCMAPFSDGVDPSCAGAVRTLAEAWFAALAGNA